MCLIVALGKPYFAALATHGGAGKHAPIRNPPSTKRHANSAPAPLTRCFGPSAKNREEGETAHAKQVRNIVVDVGFGG